MNLFKASPKTVVLFLAVITATFLSNCSSVSTPYPLADKPTAIDKQKFEGSWLIDNDGDGILQVKFSDDGIAHMAGLEWKENHFEIVRGEMVVVEGKEHNFISIRFEEKGEWKDEYFFVPYEFSELGDLIFWPPNAKEFEKAIKKKLLLGEGESNVSITSPAEELLKVLNNPGDLKLFNYKSPTVLRKIAEEKAK